MRPGDCFVQSFTGAERNNSIVGPMNNKHGTANRADKLGHARRGALVNGGDEHIRCGLQRPTHPILDLFGRMRIVRGPTEEEVEKVTTVPAPVRSVEFVPTVRVRRFAMEPGDVPSWRTGQ